MDEGNRSFIPFKVSPPPSTSGSSGTVNDYLALFPLFVPQQDESLWTGNLYAFALNSQNPTLPATGDCQIDLSLVAWDAATSLAAQLALPTPARNIFIGMENASVWTRHSVEEVGTDGAVRSDFKDRLALPALPTDLEAQEIVNFIRNIWDNPMSLDPPPQNPPRPTGYSVLGDIFHSQPVAVSPPNNPMFFYDYGFVQPGEAGAHDYQQYMNEHAKRRRVALAGANDGMIHAFDAGFFDRDDGGTYDDQHDLGSGFELFAHVPARGDGQAVGDDLRHRAAVPGRRAHRGQRRLHLARRRHQPAGVAHRGAVHDAPRRPRRGRPRHHAARSDLRRAGLPARRHRAARLHDRHRPATARPSTRA